MTAAQLEVAATLIATLAGVVTVWLTVRAQGRQRQERAEATAEARKKDLADARADGYAAGAADTRREMQPRLDLALYERDAAVRERDLALRENDADDKRIEMLEDEIRRIMRGGNGK